MGPVADWPIAKPVNPSTANLAVKRHLRDYYRLNMNPTAPNTGVGLSEADNDESESSDPSKR